jgi:hypothetical protein
VRSAGWFASGGARCNVKEFEEDWLELDGVLWSDAVPRLFQPMTVSPYAGPVAAAPIAV